MTEQIARGEALRDALLYGTLPDPHLHEISLSAKGTIAHHLRTWHRTRRQETPWKLLVQWSRDELVQTHEEYHR